jgi:hypothetical protein
MNGRSEFSKENSKIFMSCQISRRSRGDTAIILERIQSSRGAEPLIRVTRAVGSTRGFAYRGFVD